MSEGGHVLTSSTCVLCSHKGWPMEPALAELCSSQDPHPLPVSTFSLRWHTRKAQVSGRARCKTEKVKRRLKKVGRSGCKDTGPVAFKIKSRILTMTVYGWHHLTLPHSPASLLASWFILHLSHHIHFKILNGLRHSSLSIQVAPTHYSK